MEALFSSLVPKIMTQVQNQGLPIEKKVGPERHWIIIALIAGSVAALAASVASAVLSMFAIALICSLLSVTNGMGAYYLWDYGKILKIKSMTKNVIEISTEKLQEIRQAYENLLVENNNLTKARKDALDQMQTAMENFRTSKKEQEKLAQQKKEIETNLIEIERYVESMLQSEKKMQETALIIEVQTEQFKNRANLLKIDVSQFTKADGILENLKKISEKIAKLENLIKNKSDLVAQIKEESQRFTEINTDIKGRIRSISTTAMASQQAINKVSNINNQLEKSLSPKSEGKTK